MFTLESILIYRYITLFTNETYAICLFGFTVDNGGSWKIEIIGNTWRKYIIKEYY